MSSTSLVVINPAIRPSRFRRVWPSALIGLGLTLSMAWVAFIGYGIVALVARAL